MRLINFLIFIFLIALISGPVAAGTEQGEENPLVADTFTKKKHVRYFGDYETVLINYLEGGDFQFGLAGAVIIQKIGAESTSSSPISYTTDNNGTKWVAGIAAKYGVTDYLSTGASVTYANGNSSTDSVISGTPSTTSDHASGIQNITLRAQFALPTRSFGYLADLEWNPAVGKASSNAQTEESNAYSEQSSLELENYLIFNSSNVKWGPFLSYDYKFLGEVEQISSTGSSSTREISGGNTLEVGGFVELAKSYNTFFKLVYAKSESSTRVSASGVSSETPALDFLSFTTGAQIDFTRKISFVPQFQYATLLTKDISPTVSYTQVDIFGISGELRILF